jgi:hypothetical protein
MYCEVNFKTKKALKEAVKEGQELRVFAPGLGKPNNNGQEFLAGPWYPAAHSWWAEVEMRFGIITKVK